MMQSCTKLGSAGDGRTCGAIYEPMSLGTIEPSTSKRPRRLFESDSKSCTMESGSKRLSLTNRRDLAEVLEGPAGRMSCSGNSSHPMYVPEESCTECSESADGAQDIDAHSGLAIFRDDIAPNVRVGSLLDGGESENGEGRLGGGGASQV